MTETETRSLITRFFDAAEQGDLEAIKDIYADDIRVWHNNDEVEQTKEQNLAALVGAFARLVVRRYTQRQFNAFPGGFVQQHKFVATRPDGEVIEMPAVVVGKVKDGQITRIDEYFETSALGRLRAPLQK